MFVFEHLAFLLTTDEQKNRFIQKLLDINTIEFAQCVLLNAILFLSLTTKGKHFYYRKAFLNTVFVIHLSYCFIDHLNIITS